MMRDLGTGYTVEIDKVDEQSWCELLSDFRDANIYQSWTYGAVRQGENNISHLVLKRSGKTVAAAQIRLIRIPIIGKTIAYVRWGPMWRKGYGVDQAEVFRQAIRALRNEYVWRREMVLRVYPKLFNDGDPSLLDNLGEEGFSRVQGSGDSRTLIVDLTRSVEDLRKGLRQNWRHHLTRAEKNGLEVIEGDSLELFDEFLGIYDDMMTRKGFKAGSDIREFRQMQAGLSKGLSMRVLICRSNGKSCAGAICSAVGETGIPLFRATNKVGMQTKGSYLIQWRIVHWLKNKGCTDYDLNGINQASNPGTYHYKAGLSHRNGREVRFLGSFDTYEKGFGSLAFVLLDKFRYQIKKTFTTIP